MRNLNILYEKQFCNWPQSQELWFVIPCTEIAIADNRTMVFSNPNELISFQTSSITERYKETAMLHSAAVICKTLR